MPPIQLNNAVSFSVAERNYPVRVFSFDDYVRLNEWLKSSDMMRDPLSRLAKSIYKVFDISQVESETLVLCYGQAGQLPKLVKIVMQVTIEIGRKLTEQVGNNDRNS